MIRATFNAATPARFVVRCGLFTFAEDAPSRTALWREAGTFISTQHDVQELILTLVFAKRGRETSNDTHKPKPTYNVGCGRPPEAHRFKPGRSGNPAGRPRRKQSIDAAIEEALHKPVSVNEKGRQRKLPALQVIMRQLTNSAMRGHLPSAKSRWVPLQKMKSGQTPMTCRRSPTRN